jgi:hypothetical protein
MHENNVSTTIQVTYGGQTIRIEDLSSGGIPVMGCVRPRKVAVKLREDKMVKREK